MLEDELEACSVTSKSWTSAPGRLCGGKPLAGSALYPMLQNRIYAGSMQAKANIPTDRYLWDVVQALLAGEAAQRNPL